MMHRLFRTVLIGAILMASGTANARTAAPDPLAARLDQAEAALAKDLAQGNAAFDALLAKAANVRETQRIELSRCWALSAVDSAAALRFVQAKLATPEVAVKPLATARFRLCRGYALDRADRHDEALADFDNGVAEGRRLHDQVMLARALVLRGERRGADGLYADALVDLKSGYELETALRNDANIQYALNAMANLYADRHVRDYEHALEAYRAHRIFSEQHGKTQEQATSEFNIAATLEKQGKLDDAAAAYARALALDTKRGVSDDIAYDERAYAVVLSKLGNHDAALRMLDDALARSQAEKDLEQVAAVRLSRGVALGRAKRPAQGLPDLDAARAYFLAQHNQLYLETIHGERAQLLAQLGRWPEAYEARGELIAVQQAMQQQVVDDRTARLRVQFQSDQAKLQNQELAHQNENQQRELAAGATIRSWQLVALTMSVAALLALAIMMLRQLAQARRMRDLAMTDELTRLPNRRHFLTVAGEAHAQAARQNRPLALAGLDIDHFKRVNDTYGHAVGDVVLQRVAHALRSTMRPGDMVGRTGGEEFLVLLPGATLDEALGTAERLRLAVAALDCSDLHPDLKPTISLGVAARAPGQSLEQLCKLADDMLYRAKAGGRDRVEPAAAPSAQAPAHAAPGATLPTSASAA